MHLLRTGQSIVCPLVMLFVSVNLVPPAYSHDPHAPIVEKSPVNQSIVPSSGTAGQPLQVRLGYPADAKLLILNADDLAVTHSEDVSEFRRARSKTHYFSNGDGALPLVHGSRRLRQGASRSGPRLAPTLTSEWQTYRWGPIASRALVPSLVGPDGYFYPNSAEVVKHAKLDEVEIEIRAQIERAKSMGLSRGTWMRTCTRSMHQPNYSMSS